MISNFQTWAQFGCGERESEREIESVQKRQQACEPMPSKSVSSTGNK